MRESALARSQQKDWPVTIDPCFALIGTQQCGAANINIGQLYHTEGLKDIGGVKWMKL